MDYKEGSVEVRRTGGAYYTLIIDGKFEGNYDTMSEAVKAAEEKTVRKMIKGAE